MTQYNLAMLQRIDYREPVKPPPQPINPIVPAGRWSAWMAKQALWVLRKMGVQHQPPDKMIERAEYLTFNDDDVFRELHLGRREIARIWHGDVKYILCGRDYWARITDRVYEQSILSMNINARLAMDGETRVMGLRLVVLPWIQGMALLPELSEVR